MNSLTEIITLSLPLEGHCKLYKCLQIDLLGGSCPSLCWWHCHSLEMGLRATDEDPNPHQFPPFMKTTKMSRNSLKEM